ncbi:MAG: exodeoxyribonuclease III [Candidatus Halichondribacter symbioticus]
MKIATFNINGIKARMVALLAWLEQARPDIVFLQEIKSVNEAFPREPIEDLGYEITLNGQKGFNGVAILSRYPLEDISVALPGDDTDEQARWLEATVIGEADSLRLCNLYLPNGNPAPGPKYDYKLAWMARLEMRLAQLLHEEQPFLCAGDFNIIPQAEDCWDESAWRDDALYLLSSRTAYRRIINLGLTDAYRTYHQGAGAYTFWDYQSGSWAKNHGIRIDHILLCPRAADYLNDCQIDQDTRDGERPSDHVPIWVDVGF